VDLFAIPKARTGQEGERGINRNEDVKTGDDRVKLRQEAHKSEPMARYWGTVGSSQQPSHAAEWNKTPHYWYFCEVLRARVQKPARCLGARENHPGKEQVEEDAAHSVDDIQAVKQSAISYLAPCYVLLSFSFSLAVQLCIILG
jgi:hypothetical protein